MTILTLSASVKIERGWTNAQTGCSTATAVYGSLYVIVVGPFGGKSTNKKGRREIINFNTTEKKHTHTRKMRRYNIEHEKVRGGVLTCYIQDSISVTRMWKWQFTTYWLVLWWTLLYLSLYRGIPSPAIRGTAMMRSSYVRHAGKKNRDAVTYFSVVLAV